MKLNSLSLSHKLKVKIKLNVIPFAHVVKLKKLPVSASIATQQVGKM